MDDTANYTTIAIHAYIYSYIPYKIEVENEYINKHYENC